ncbi:Uncharacterised protein [Bordetella pertussis]|nr:Uncharacterised protein [Bordetella pertussis]CFP56977.1 Uncharacterised protein [Bordetella pertussis]CFW31112.1 Uncharacterised protein [Bordetella pertussis]
MDSVTSRIDTIQVAVLSSGRKRISESYFSVSCWVLS